MTSPPIASATRASGNECCQIPACGEKNRTRTRASATLLGGELAIPADVLRHADLDRIRWRVAEHAARLVDAERAAERHQVVARHVLDLDVREVLFDHADELFDRARVAMGEVEDFVLRRGARDRADDAG